MLVIIQVALSMTVLAPHKGLASSASEVANEVRSESDFFFHDRNQTFEERLSFGVSLIGSVEVPQVDKDLSDVRVIGTIE